MIDVNEVYLIIQNLLRKNQQGYLTPAEYIRYANMAVRSRFNELYGRLETVVDGKQRRNAYADNQQTDEKLSVYLVVASAQSVDSTTGQISKPAGLIRMDSINHTTTSILPGKVVPVKRRNKDQESFMANNAVTPPTEEYPFYVDYGAYYQVYPKDIGDIDWSYLGNPIDVNWAYTLDGSGRPIYNSGASVHFQFEAVEIGNIVSKVLGYAGKSVGDIQAITLGQQLEIKGQ